MENTNRFFYKPSTPLIFKKELESFLQKNKIDCKVEQCDFCLFMYFATKQELLWFMLSGWEHNHTYTFYLEKVRII